MAITSEQFSNHVIDVNGANARAPASAVSWGAIFAGAAAAAALSMILLILGTGLGLSSISPWAYDGASAKAIGISTILWVSFTQLIASGMGGYLAGRLRTKWIAVPTDEVHFRDTAHGFLAWCVASLATAALLTSVIGSILGSGIQAGGAAVGAATSTAATAAAGYAGADTANADQNGGPVTYFVDSLFRKDASVASPSSDLDNATPSSTQETATTISSAEVARIFVLGIYDERLPPEDLRYVGQSVAQRTGLSQQDAEQRVSDTFLRLQTRLNKAETSVKEAADKARKASAYAALWLFISLLIGAFIASLAATFGGRQRDQ